MSGREGFEAFTKSDKDGSNSGSGECWYEHCERFHETLWSSGQNSG